MAAGQDGETSSGTEPLTYWSRRNRFTVSSPEPERTVLIPPRYREDVPSLLSSCTQPGLEVKVALAGIPRRSTFHLPPAVRACSTRPLPYGARRNWRLAAGSFGKPVTARPLTLFSTVVSGVTRLLSETRM